MAFMWTCECEALNKSRDTICTLCGRDRNNQNRPACPGRDGATSRLAALFDPPGPPPCTREQNLEAAQVLREVTLRLLTIDQALARLGEIFGPAAVSAEP